MATKAIVRYRARPKKKTRRRAKFSVSLAVLAGFAPMISKGISEFQTSPQAGLNGLAWRLTGIDPATGRFSMRGLQQGILPIGAGVLVHKIASKFGVNRMIAKAIPFVRI